MQARHGNQQLNDQEAREQNDRLAALWASVMLLTIEDLLHGNHFNPHNENQRTAFDWIFGNKGNPCNTFNHLCELLRVEPEEIREEVLKAYPLIKKKHDSWRVWVEYHRRDKKT